MPRKTTLYIDIDDTIIAQVLPGSGFDLRPCVMTQLRVLGRMYDCCWLTMWPHTAPKHLRSREDRMSIVTLMASLYGAEINEAFRCADWDQNHEQGKAEFVLRKDAPDEWYWIEDPLFKIEREALAAAGHLDRYICVEPHGPWGFLDAVNELFRRSGKSANDIKRVGGRPEWFDKAAIATDKSCGGQLITKPSDPRDVAQEHSGFLQSGIEMRDALGATAEADEPDRIAQDGCRRRTGSGKKDPR
ncbi:MAG: hypothetical protein ABSE96_05330 [Terracidiphilus sp.]|jgi:hypothetical protein